MVDVIEPTEAMALLARETYLGSSKGFLESFETALRAALNHPDVRGLFGAPADPELKAAAEDALSGWRYIRGQHGDLYGVAWDRVQNALASAIMKANVAALPVAAPTPAVPTVSVRVPVLVAPSGDWVAWTKSNDDGEGQQHARWYLSDAPFFTTHMLTATLPIPQPVEIAATVEGAP